MKKYFVQIKYPNEVPLGKSIVKVLLEKAGIDTSEEEESDVSKPTIQRYITHLAVATNKGQLNDFSKENDNITIITNFGSNTFIINSQTGVFECDEVDIKSVNIELNSEFAIIDCIIEER